MSRTNISMLDFIRAHESSNSSAEVSQKTGLTEASVQAKASKFRNPEYFMVQKTDDKGRGLYRTDTGGETTDVKKAKRNSQNKPIQILIKKLDADGTPIVKRQAIPLKMFPRGGGSRIDVNGALALLEELRSETAN